VLGLAIAHHLYERFPERAEGDLAKVRAHVVSRQSCATVAIDIGLDRDLRARGTQLGTATVEIDSLAGSPGVLAAIVEAVAGATYLHFGLDTVAGAVVQHSRDGSSTPWPSTSTTRRSCRRTLHVGVPR
jgi:ribonuclease-3